MKFKSGDIIIKKTGGNKMTIIFGYNHEEKNKYIYRCYWFVENSLNEYDFDESDIVTIDEYQKILKTEERDDKINQLLSKFNY